jgi:hypothetical protein
MVLLQISRNPSTMPTSGVDCSAFIPPWNPVEITAAARDIYHLTNEDAEVVIRRYSMFGGIACNTARKKRVPWKRFLLLLMFITPSMRLVPLPSITGKFQGPVSILFLPKPSGTVLCNGDQRK